MPTQAAGCEFEGDPREVSLGFQVLARQFPLKPHHPNLNLKLAYDAAIYNPP